MAAIEIERAACGGACVHVGKRGVEDGARGASQIVLRVQSESVKRVGRIDGDVVAKRIEASLADAAHDDEMFDAAKRSVTLAVFDDACGQPRADTGQTL